MTIGSTFSVSGYQLDRNIINPGLIRDMAESAKGIRLEGNPEPQAWSDLADRVESSDSVSAQDLRQLEDLGRPCFNYRKELRADFRASGYKSESIRSELSDVCVFRAGTEKISESLSLAKAKAAVEALAGASFGPTSLVAAYVAYSDLQKSQLEPMMQDIQGLRDGSSPNLYQGNAVQAFHGDEIWPQMNAMLDGAIASAQAGNPQEVDAQYYELTSHEIVGKLAQAAQAGCKVRVNVDPGRLVAFKGSHVVITEVPDKLRALIQLSQSGDDVGVSMYPIEKKLGQAGNLMHRKGLRVGDTFLLSGMNANAGSGENIDAGYTIEGPAAERLTKNFRRDVGDSANATPSEIFGEKPLADFMEGDVNMGTRGLISLFDCANGPSAPDRPLPRASTLEELESIAESMGQKVSDYTDMPREELAKCIREGKEIPLSQGGKQHFLDLVERTVAIANSPENLAKLEDIDLPSGDPKGMTAVALADVPSERRATMIQAIQDAEKFVYVPGFVMTRSVAAVLVAKRDEMAAQGKEFEIKVVADAGVYPDGGSPNIAGLQYLEDHGIDVHWTLLPRSSDHDRKVHAKEILTDKGEFFGSTNFSNKGMGANWEHSGYVQFNPDDPQSVAQQQSALEHFNNLWENESFTANSRATAERRCQSSKGNRDYQVRVEDERRKIMRDTIKGILRFEKASAKYVAQVIDSDPTSKGRIADLVKKGYDEGSATLIVAKENVGEEKFYQDLHSMPAYKSLEEYK
ncbi:hypothetical protein IJT10_08090 [bacterium]|nr:hypothetical protein [bacterium]